MHHPRGKVIGGTRAINSFALIYPSAAGIDAWADLGNPGWDYATMKPYFRKFQHIYRPSNEVTEQLSLFHDEGAIHEANGLMKHLSQVKLIRCRKPGWRLGATSG